MNKQQQQWIISSLMGSADLLAKCDAIIQPSYFDVEFRKAVKFVQDYYHTYKARPSAEILANEVGLAIQPRESTRDELKYAADEIEKFCRHKAILQAISNSPSYIEKGDLGGLERLIREAVQVSLVRDIGISLFDDAETILKQLMDTQAPIPTGYDEVDKHLFGGPIRKQLMVISGPSGGGKSITMNNLSLNFVEAGLKVLFVSLELSQDLNYLRLASMITGISQNGWQLQMEQMAEKMSNYQSVYGGGSKGNLYIKRMPIGTKPSAIRSAVKEFELLHGAPPDVLVVDYLDIMGSDVKVPAENIHLKDKYATEDLREVCNEFDMIGITGSQLKKEAQDAVDTGAAQVGGGQTKMNTADVWGTVLLTDEMKSAGVVGIKWLKTRTSDGKGKISFMKFDPISLRFTNFSGGLNSKEEANFRALISRATKKLAAATGVELDDGDGGASSSVQSQPSPKMSHLQELLNRQRQMENMDG